MRLTLATIAPGVPEIFASVQGEGPSSGTPCAFVRLSRCNLACHWCDTAYTWRFQGDARPHRDGLHYERKDEQVALTIEDTAARIAALEPRRLVITGGEPLLQGVALAKLAALLAEHTIEIETNGTVAPHPALDPRIAQYNVSLKLAHSGNPAALALLPERLRQWAADERAVFKFVVAAPGDVTQVLTLQHGFGIAPDRIWLMPEGTDSAALREREAWLAPLSAEHGYRFSDRLHIHLYGDTRGT
jgi:7-carboxy-7-deazaguanine synthase